MIKLRLRLVHERLRNAYESYGLRRNFGSSSMLFDIATAIRIAAAPRLVVLFYPERPHMNSVDKKLCALLGYAITRFPQSKVDVVFRHNDITVSDVIIENELDVTTDQVVNAGCRDIGKDTLMKAFEDIFGYPIKIDPTSFSGRIAVKSIKNASKDCEFITGPISESEVDPTLVYQVALDTTINPSGYLEVLRLPVYNGKITVGWKSLYPQGYKSAAASFKPRFYTVDELLSSEEQRNLIQLCKEMRAEYCEIECMRDQAGLLYAIDLNNTPHGPGRMPTPVVVQLFARTIVPYEDLLKAFKLPQRRSVLRTRSV